MQNPMTSAVGTSAFAPDSAPALEMSGWTKAIGAVWAAFAALRVIQLLISIPAFASELPLVSAACLAFLVWEFFQVFCGVWLTQGRDLGRKVIRGVLLVRVFFFGPISVLAMLYMATQFPMTGPIPIMIGVVALFYAVYFGLSYLTARHLGTVDTRMEMID